MPSQPRQAFLPPCARVPPGGSLSRARSSLCARRASAPVAARVRMGPSATDQLGLPSALRTYVDKLSAVPDPKLRYQQLLFLARQLPPMHAALKTDATRVRGCTSVVHVHVSLDDAGRVHLQGDSDAQLTKGLLALLVNGLDGALPRDVVAVDPQFIAVSGLSVSLTPSRNNGFVNMLAKIKDSVRKLEEARDAADPDAAEPSPQSDVPDIPGRPVYSAILRKLAALKPQLLHVDDESAQHAGHAGAKGLNGESHFAVRLVSLAFEGLSMVQRHRLVYTLLQEEMSAGSIHALSIDAKTPEEAAAE